jgi:hypothetical protein
MRLTSTALQLAQQWQICHFGGGTPSIVDRVRRSFPFLNGTVSVSDLTKLIERTIVFVLQFLESVPSAIEFRHRRAIPIGEG